MLTDFPKKSSNILPIQVLIFEQDKRHHCAYFMQRQYSLNDRKILISRDPLVSTQLHIWVDADMDELLPVIYRKDDLQLL